MASAVAELRPLTLGRSRCRPFATGLAIMSSDLTAIALAWTVALAEYFFNGAQLATTDCLVPAGAAILLIAMFGCSGFYPGAGMGPVEELRRVIRLTTAAYMSLVLVTFLLHIRPYPPLILVLSWVLTISFVLLGRNLVRKFAGSLAWWGCPAILLGAGPGACAILQVLRSDPGIGIRVHAAVDDRGNDDSLDGLPLVGLNEIPGLAQQMGIKRAIIAGPVNTFSVAELIKLYGRYFPNLIVCPDVRMPSSLCVETSSLGGLLTFDMRQKLVSKTARLYKRAHDLILASVLGALLLPTLITIACAVVFSSSGTVFYAHRRIGKDGKVFKMWKFRTMVPNADQVLERHLKQDTKLRLEWERDHKLRNDPRVTRVGAFLRKRSLDELPQIWNVLQGEMSLIGPRPIVSAEVPKYGAEYEVLSSALPGLTGLWQISGRNDTTYQKRVELDSHYVQNWSPWLDLYILSRTFSTVINGRGAC